MHDESSPCRNGKMHRHGCHGHGPHGGRGCRHGGGEHMDQDMLARRRKFGARELQLMFLALLSEKPRHGYELIKEIEQRSNGYYAPSPGVVYPALTFLEDTGLLEVEVEGNRKCYRISDAGRAQLATEEEESRVVLARLAFIGKKMEVMRRAMAGEGGEADVSGWLPEFIEARRALKHALLLKTEADEAEQRRIAAILQRAAGDIEGSDHA
jgi:DNA-binding PadR family transcriptional regulator